MGKLVMSFRGLCMHVHNNRVPLPEGIEHRVICINARIGHTVPTYGRLVSHVCFFEVLPAVRKALLDAGLPIDARGHFSMRGANVSIENAIGDPLTTHLEALPSLSSFSKGMALRSDVFEGDDAPAYSACYVDMSKGSLVATEHPLGGVYTTWTVETPEGEDPVLRIRWRDEHEPMYVPVPSTPDGAILSDNLPGSIVLQNTAVNADDKTYDFVLYYYVARAGGIPPVFTKPFPIDPETSAFVGLTTSCSNSDYP